MAAGFKLGGREPQECEPLGPDPKGVKGMGVISLGQAVLVTFKKVSMETTQKINEKHT